MEPKQDDYIPRAIEKTLAATAVNFPVTMVCGPRQVGKTTLLRNTLPRQGDLSWVTLDDPLSRAAAKSDPGLFLQRYPAPLVIDEFQYAPELLPHIKMRVDEEGGDGRFFLTGSQLFSMMRNVGESLAGRVGVLSLYSLSEAELAGRGGEFFLPGAFDAVARARESKTDLPTIANRIFRGGMPRMVVRPDLTPDVFFGSYVQTYLERDIRDLALVRDETRFIRFISCVAARTGQEVVYEDLARAAEVDNNTARSWLSLLAATGIVFLLQPWAANLTKRIVKRPKLYFMDTGLCCYLAHASNPRTLMVSQLAGPMFETFVATQIIKSFASRGMDPHHYLYYYRDKNGNEIDMLIAHENKLHPVEIKLSSDPGRHAARHFRLVPELGLARGHGAVICMSPNVVPIDALTDILPVQVV